MHSGADKVNLCVYEYSFTCLTKEYVLFMSKHITLMSIVLILVFVSSTFLYKYISETNWQQNFVSCDKIWLYLFHVSLFYSIHLVIFLAH